MQKLKTILPFKIFIFFLVLFSFLTSFIRCNYIFKTSIYNGNEELITGTIIDYKMLDTKYKMTILTNKDNIFNLNIGPDDTPEMKAVKEAINLKQVDIKNYENRFDQFQNDIRLLKGKSITLGKLISTCSNFDIVAELTLTDKPGCANPMNSTIKIDLTERGD